MAMATVTNSKSQGVKIALAKAQRAYELMQAFRRASVNQKNNWKDIEMWYFVIKNGKAIKAYRTGQKALAYADAKVSFNPLRDVLRVVREDGEILKEF